MPVDMTAETSPLAFNTNTGTLYWGDQEITGLASRDMVLTTTFDISSSIQERIAELEDELSELLRKFTADFVKELVRRCEQFVNNQELTGITDEEFEVEIRNLLFVGGV